MLFRSGFTYTLRSYKTDGDNAGIYFTRSQTSGTGGDLYYLSEDAIGENWNTVTANATTGTGVVFEKLANSLDASSKATNSAFFYIENGEHHYLYVNSSSLYRVDVDKNGNIKEGSDLQIAYNIGSATIIGIDNTTEPDGYHYVYFTRSNGSGLSVERAVYNGNADDYRDLVFQDPDGSKHENDAYKSVKVLNLQHVSGWYNWELIDDIVFYVDAETFGGTAYNYTSCVSLKKDGKLMNNLELKAFNDLYDSITNTGDKTIGLFAKLNDVFSDSDLSNALKYYFYTGKSEQFHANIDEATEVYGQKATYLYTEEEQKAFDAFVKGEDYTLNGKTIFKAGDYKFAGDTSDTARSTYSYFRTQLGQMNDADEEAYEAYWKTSGLAYYNPPAEDESGLAWWAWMLIAFAIAAFVAGVVVFCLWFFIIRKKKTVVPVERRKVDTTDNRDIDVYADEESETPATEEEPAEAEAPAEEEIPTEDAEAVEASETAEPEAPAEAPQENPEA